MSDYSDCYEYLSGRFSLVDGCDFYQEIFPENERVGEQQDDYSDPNAIYLYRDGADEGTERRLRRRIMLKDTWEQDYKDHVQGNSMALCSGLSFSGMVNRLSSAQRMNALIFDLDAVGLNELLSLFLRFGGDPEHIRMLPMPTFLVLSGTGLHVYYVFEEPVELFPYIKMQMKSLKYDLTFRMWEYGGTSELDTIQYQSINQGFRMVGSINDKYGVDIVAFRTGDRVTLDYLNAYAEPKNRVDQEKRFRPSKMTREEAKERYPDWYERVVVRGEKGKKKWDIAGKVHGEDPYALYHWWMKQRDKVVGGHRYFFMMCFAIYAYKCDVPKSKLRKDMQIVFEDLRHVEHVNVLTEGDVESAMEAYDREYFNFTIADIEKLSNIRIDKNKRNGRKQADHVQLMNVMKDFKKKLGEPINEGRPNAYERVCEWRRENPEGSKSRCREETGLSYPTIRRWWDI